MSYRIGIDVGGTFTDCVLRRDDGSMLLEKAPTTPDDQSEGVVAGLAQLAAAEGISVDDLIAATRTIVHGTTTGDNTMIQMTGAPTGLLVTTGFRDEIEFRRCYKEEIWDPAYPPPEPIARRRVRLEVDERLTAEGDIETPMDEEGLRKAVARLRAFGVTSIAVSFLHSYLNPVHELRAKEIILDEYPDVEMISLSHQVLPKLDAMFKEIPEIIECHRVTGDDSLILKVYATSISHLEKIIHRLTSYGMPATSIVLSSPIPHRRIERKMAESAAKKPSSKPL